MTVTLQAQRAGQGAAEYLKNGLKQNRHVYVKPGDGISYVVPAIVHPGEVKETKEFFFRTKGLADKAVIRAVSDGKVIRKLNRTKLMPSEMERITLTDSQLNELTGDLVIEMEELK